MHILEILLIVRECSFYKCNISVNISNIQSQSQSQFEVINFCYQNLGLIYFLVFKLYAFLQRSNFGNFQQFFYHNFLPK